MPIFDSQVHAYERNHPGRPWVGTLHGPAEVTGDQMVAAMDEVGVDGAVLVSPFSMYRYDASYALEVFAKHPSRFRLVKPVDPTDPRVADTIAAWAATKGTVGIRIFLRDAVSTDPADPAINRVLATAAQHSLPVNVACTGRLDQARQLAARNPNTRMVIDHLGLPQPQEPPAERPDAAPAPETTRDTIATSGASISTATATTDRAPIIRPDPPAAPAAPADVPNLQIVTEPSGARVTVDGIGWGQTPVTIRYLPHGTKRVRVTLDGYDAQEQVVQLAPDSPTTVRFALRRTP